MFFQPAGSGNAEGSACVQARPGNAGTCLIREVQTVMDRVKTKRSTAVSVATAAVAAVALGAAVTGCQEQNAGAQSETVSTASAAAVIAAAQASNCPSVAPQTLTSNATGLGGELEPIDATRLLLCVYAGRDAVQSVQSVQPSGSGQSAAPASSAVINSATVTDAGAINTLRNALNALTVPPTQRVNCPNDIGSAVLGIFTNGQQEVEVLMTTSGCPKASNGQKTGWVGASDFGDVLAAVLKG